MTAFRRRPDLLIIAGNARSLMANRGDLVRALIQRGRHVAALVPEWDYLAEVEHLGIPIYRVSLRRTGLNPLHDLSTMAEIYRHIRSLQPKAVFCYTVKPIVFGVPAARLAGVQGVYAMVTGLGHTFTTSSPRTRVLRSLLTLLYRSATRSCTRIFFQNPDDLREFTQRKIIDDHRSVVCVNGSGVNLSHFALRPVPSTRPVFLFVGRLLTEKGIAEFCDAAHELSREGANARFVAVGPHDPTLPHAVSERSLEAWRKEAVVEFPGGARDVRPWIEQCTVFVLPSYREGMPRSVLEAMSMGRAIVTTDAPGCRETVAEGLNGFLVPPRNSCALAATMRRFIHTPDLAVRMGVASRRIAEEKFDVNTVNRILIEAMEL